MVYTTLRIQLIEKEKLHGENSSQQGYERLETAFLYETLAVKAIIREECAR